MKKRIILLFIACLAAVSDSFGQLLSDVSENLGTFSSAFSKEWVVYPQNCENPYAHYVFKLTTPMDVVVSHCESTLEGRTGIFIYDEKDNSVASSTGSYECIDGHAYAVGAYLLPGTYSLDIDWSSDVQGFVHTKIEGLRPDIIRSAKNIGEFYKEVGFMETRDTGDPYVGYRGPGSYQNSICYSFYMEDPMDLTISNCGSQVENTEITLLDETGTDVDMLKLGVRAEGSCDNPGQGYLKRLNMPAGKYHVISKGINRNGRITTIITGTKTAAVPSITEFAIKTGTIEHYDRLFVYEDTKNTSNPSIGYQGYDDYRSGACYKLTLPCTMDVELSHCGSEVRNTQMYLLDKDGNRLAYNNGYSGINACDNPNHAYLAKSALTAGVYYVVSVGKDGSTGYITTRIVCKALEGQVGSTDRNYVRTRTFRDAYGATWQDKVEYFDGMGRREEIVLAEASPLEYDIASLMEYDTFGRLEKQWLQAEVWSGECGAYISPETLKQRIRVTNSKDSIPYQLTKYEQSPLDRPLEVYGPGREWHSHGKSVSTQYRLTNMEDNDTLKCIDFQVQNTVEHADTLFTIIPKRYCPSGSFEVTKRTDEDGNVVYEFKNSFGQTVLNRQCDKDSMYKWHDTYYIYDEWGNLLAVLPPGISFYMRNLGFNWDNALDAEIRDYAYLYKYDDRFRVIAKRLPGQGWIRYVYDKSDHPVFTRDEKQRKRGEWSFSITDGLGRACLTGICKNSFELSRNSLDAVVNANRDDSIGVYKGYAISGIVLVDAKVMAVNYYDDYNFMGKNGFPSSTDGDYGYEQLPGYGERKQNGTFSLLTGTLTAHLDSVVGNTLRYIPSVMYYDYRGRMIQSKSGSHLLGGVEKEYIAYDFTGNPLKRKHIYAAPGQTPRTEEYSYTYDHMGRPIYTKHRLNGGREMVLADNAYDGLGRLSTRLRGRSSNLESWCDYNVRSQLTAVGGFLFNQKLYYNEQRMPSGTNRPCYNGNISGMDWSVASENTLRGYDYTYDCLSRLKSADYLEGNARKPGCFDTSYSYTNNGNLVGLKRYGQIGEDGYGLIDDLRIVLSGNQLKSVTDHATASAYNDGFEFKDGCSSEVEYNYDENGNLTKDLNKNIVDIQYNYLNLPCLIKFADGNSISYLYDANGKKLRTTHIIGNDTTLTDYCGNVTYENGVAKALLVEGGYVSLSDNKYHFYFQDHQGNNRVVADENGNIEEVNHYYPFGGTFANTSSVQPYKYNGKELDRKGGLDWYDYGARHYDAALGRWHAVDPMAEKHYSISPYNYCGNEPIGRIDPDGADWRVQTHYNEETKKIEYHITVNAVLYNNSNMRNVDMQKLATNITEQINSTYSINDNDFVSKMDFKLRVVNSVDEINDSDHILQIVNQRDFRNTGLKENKIAADSYLSGLGIRLGTDLIAEMQQGRNGRTVAHELGHTGGLGHLNDDPRDRNNLMMQAYYVWLFKGDYNNATQLNHDQIRMIRDNYIHKRLHQGSPLRRNWWGKKQLR